LTVHKTQGLTLQLDETIFACAQAYVAISRAKSWNDIALSSFRPDVFRVDQSVVKEYERLRTIADTYDIFNWKPINRQD